MEALKAQSIQAGIGTGLARQPSSDSVSSLSSACSLDKHEKKKKKGWVLKRSLFTISSIALNKNFIYSCVAHLPKHFQGTPK